MSWPRERWPAQPGLDAPSKGLLDVMAVRVQVGIATAYLQDEEYDKALAVLDDLNEAFDSGEPWWLPLAVA